MTIDTSAEEHELRNINMKGDEILKLNEQINGNYLPDALRQDIIKSRDNLTIQQNEEIDIFCHRYGKQNP